MWAAVSGWLHRASFQCQVRAVQAQGRIPTQPLDFCHLGWATSLSPCCLGDGFTDTRRGAFLFLQAHAALCPITHSTRLLPIRIPLLLLTPPVSLPHWILLFWVVWGAPNSSVVDFNFTSWVPFTNLGVGLLHKIKPAEECRNRNLDSAHGRKLSFWTDSSHT